MMPCIQPCGSSSVLENCEKLLDLNTTPNWAIMLVDWLAKASENISFCDWAVASSEVGHRIVALMLRHCHDDQHLIISSTGLSYPYLIVKTLRYGFEMIRV